MVDSLRIDGRFIKRATKKACVTGKAQKTRVLFDCAKCDTEYALRIRSWSEQIDFEIGWQPNYSTYTAVTPACCDDCTTDATCADIVTQLVTAINSDIYSCVTASAAAGADLILDDVTYTCGIVLTGTTKNQACSCMTDLNYDKLVGVNFEVGLFRGWDCCGVVDYTTDMSHSEGSGYSIRRKESDAAGYSQGLLYRQSNDAWLYNPTTYAKAVAKLSIKGFTYLTSIAIVSFLMNLIPRRHA